MAHEHGESEPSPSNVEIDLQLEEIRDRGIRLLSDVGYPTEPFGAYLFASSSPDAELARYVEQIVFEETFGNSRQMLDEEYRPYEDATIFVCVMDHATHLPVGAMRLITTSAAGFKTLDDLRLVWGKDLDQLKREHRLDLDVSSMMDVTTISVIRDYRGAATDGLVTLALLQVMSVVFQMCSTKWAVSVMDLLALDRIQGLIAEPCQVFPDTEPRRYLDSPASVPVYIDLDRYYERLRTMDPVMYDMGLGFGLETAVRPVHEPGAVLARTPMGAPPTHSQLATRRVS